MAERLLVKAQGNPVGYDKDLVEQINKCLRARDQVLDALLAEPVCFAFALGFTNGAGSITTTYAFGCTLELQGTSVVARFTKKRPNTIYTFGGMMIVPAAVPQRIITSEQARQGLETCAIVYRDAGGGNYSASTNAFGTTIWAIGPRA